MRYVQCVIIGRVGVSLAKIEDEEVEMSEQQQHYEGQGSTQSSIHYLTVHGMLRRIDTRTIQYVGRFRISTSTTCEYFGKSALTRMCSPLPRA